MPLLLRLGYPGQVDRVGLQLCGSHFLCVCWQLSLVGGSLAERALPRQAEVGTKYPPYTGALTILLVCKPLTRSLVG